MQAKHFLFSPYFDIPLLVGGGKQPCQVYVGISDSHGSQQQQAVSRQYSCARDVCLSLSETLSVTHLWNATEKQGSSFCLKPSPFSHNHHTFLFVCFCKIQTNTFVLRPFTAVSASLCCGLQWNLALLPGSRRSQSTLKPVISVRKDSIQKSLPLAFLSTCPFTYKPCLWCKRFTEVWQQFNKVKSKRQKNSTFSSCHKHDRTTKTIPFSAFSFQ